MKWHVECKILVFFLKNKLASLPIAPAKEECKNKKSGLILFKI